MTAQEALTSQPERATGELMKKTEINKLDYEAIVCLAYEEIEKAQEYLRNSYSLNDDDLFDFRFSYVDDAGYAQFICLIDKIINETPEEQLRITRDWLDDNYFMVPVEYLKQTYVELESIMKTWYLEEAHTSKDDYVFNFDDVDEDTGRPYYTTSLIDFLELYLEGTRLLKNIKPLFGY